MGKSKILMSLIILILLSFFKLTGISAQNNSVINDSIYSDILKEERSIKIIMPDNYKSGSSERYEVIYLTDGEWVAELFPFIYKFARGARRPYRYFSVESAQCAEGCFAYRGNLHVQ